MRLWQILSVLIANVWYTLNWACCHRGTLRSECAIKPDSGVEQSFPDCSCGKEAEVRSDMHMQFGTYAE